MRAGIDFKCPQCSDGGCEPRCYDLCNCGHALECGQRASELAMVAVKLGLGLAAPFAEIERALDEACARTERLQKVVCLWAFRHDPANGVNWCRSCGAAEHRPHASGCEVGAALAPRRGAR